MSNIAAALFLVRVKKGVHIARAMQNADNINAVLKRKIENQVASTGMATQARLKIIAACPHLREVGQRQTSFLNAIKKPVRIVGVVLRDIQPDFVEIAFGFWPF
jgi:uncharacterized protein YwlG (UPF0340 family)